MNAPNISQAVRLHNEIKTRLLDGDPDLDDQTLADTLDGETDLTERIVRLCRAALESERQAETLAGMIKDMQARKKRFEARGDHLRGIALWAMQEAEMPSIVAPDATVTIRAGRTTVVVSNADELPMWALKYEPTPNKDAIKQALEDGQECPGASLSNGGPSISIRVR